MSNEQSLRDVVLLFHAILVSFGEVSGNGMESCRRILFHLSPNLPPILEKYGFNISRSKDSIENAQLILSILVNSGLVEGVEFKEIDDRTYELKVSKCTMAIKELHERLNLKEAFCPYGILITGIINGFSEDDFVLYSCDFTDMGSITTIKRFRYVLR
jgi:hypothetical protein